MTDSLKKLIEISRYYGSDPSFVIAGGGNTSYKDEAYIWVKASGYSLANITSDGFVQLYRDKVKVTGTKHYSDDPHKRETEVKEDLLAARVHPESGLRPSVETSLHEVIEYPFIVHTHPTLVNALMCSLKAEEETLALFGENVLYVPYAPGYALFKKVSDLLQEYRKKYTHDPHLIFLQNHGIFVGAADVDEIRALYDMVIGKIRNRIHDEAVKPLPEHHDTPKLVREILALCSEDHLTASVRHNTLTRYFYSSEERFGMIARPFIPDIVVYCGPAYLFSQHTEIGDIVRDIKEQWTEFYKRYGKNPKMILVRDYGLIAVEKSEQQAETALDVFEDFMKISKYSLAFGGPHPMPEDEIDFVDKWEVEQYRRKVFRGRD